MQSDKENIKKGNKKWSNKIGDIYDLKKLCQEKGLKLKEEKNS